MLARTLLLILRLAVFALAQPNYPAESCDPSRAALLCRHPQVDYINIHLDYYLSLRIAFDTGARPPQECICYSNNTETNHRYFVYSDSRTTRTQLNLAQFNERCRAFGSDRFVTYCNIDLEYEDARRSRSRTSPDSTSGRGNGRAKRCRIK